MGKDRSMIAEVDNSVNARKGDRVIVEINDSESMKAVLIALGLPLLVLIVGTIAFSNFAQNMGFGNSGEIIGGIGGFLLMALTFVAIRRYDRRIEKRQSSNMKIVDIVRPNQLNL
jgi:sigma-E factor negative regulatory protein RseC